MNFVQVPRRQVSTKYRGRIGAPPPRSAASKASAAASQGSAKQRRDLALVKANQRGRSMGYSPSPTFDPPGSTRPGGGGGALAPSNGNGEWYKNQWLWLGAGLAALLLFNRNRKK